MHQRTSFGAIQNCVDGAESNVKQVAQRFGSDLLSDAYTPECIYDDMTTVSLPQEHRPDLITSFDSIEYAADKLAAIANWYNQLADDGVHAHGAGNRRVRRVSVHDVEDGVRDDRPRTTEGTSYDRRQRSTSGRCSHRSRSRR